jgi:hypothetical protein
MNTIQQTVTIPENRCLRLDVSLPDNIPSGRAEMLIVLSPVQKAVPAQSLAHLAGCLADSKTFADDPVHLQKALRNEW